MEIIGIIIELVITAFLILKFCQIELNLRSIAANIKVLAQNQKTYIEEKLKEKSSVE